MLKLSDIEQEESGFVVTFYKGKSYQFGESNLGVISNLPSLPFNPAKVFSIYLDRFASLHANSNHGSDLLFPSCRISKDKEVSLDKSVSYSVISKQFREAVADSNIEIGLDKVGLHCMRRVGVTHAVRAGAPCKIKVCG